MAHSNRKLSRKARQTALNQIQSMFDTGRRAVDGKPVLRVASDAWKAGRKTDAALEQDAISNRLNAFS